MVWKRFLSTRPLQSELLTYIFPPAVVVVVSVTDTPIVGATFNWKKQVFNYPEYLTQPAFPQPLFVLALFLLSRSSRSLVYCSARVQAGAFWFTDCSGIVPTGRATHRQAGR
ncbi:hypothetical protein PoB_004616300 [Plakobranchus ocellatus]|uniref:Uncharacterized protein n=1 Tax=Plakobranchus ocellatus TaxID=259542 RepID=A0AAV4BJA0_9GAST|nr:hypothetical protein PoB_004616300 [Plakobranchus ocellatus]